LQSAPAAARRRAADLEFAEPGSKRAWRSIACQTAATVKSSIGRLTSSPLTAAPICG
jgi:hypothetical protein